MIHPVLSRIQGQRKGREPVFVHLFVQMQQDRQAGPQENSVRRFKRNVEVGDISDVRCLKAIGGQEFFDRKMRELHDFRVLVVDDGDKRGTRSEYSVFWAFWPPALHESRDHIRTKFDCKYLSQLFNMKRPNSCSHTLEKSMGVLPFLFGDPLQNPLISLI